MNEQEKFLADCADFRCACQRFLRGSIESDELIAVLRDHADRWPALQPQATYWMAVDRTLGLDNLALRTDAEAAMWSNMQFKRRSRGL